MKKRLLQKIIFTFLTLLIFTKNIFASPADSVVQYTLENGLTVFILEDVSSPIIRIELAVKAGFSSQTQSTSGFFKLYSRIFEQSLPQLVFEDASCYSDSSRYILSSTPSQTKKIFSLLAQTAFNPLFTDETIKNELNKLKAEVKENASSMATLINSAIDSKVFSDTPWKHDSGLYAPLFNKTTLEQCRSILASISERWYTPQNSALFISGNVNSKEILSLIQQTFGSYYSTYQVPKNQNYEQKNTQKKFVIHNSELSPDMSQIVIQYTNIDSMENADLIAAILNNDRSFFKFNLLNQPELNIPGAEYIDVQAAHKKGNSRIIIQSLMQPPEDKKTQVNSLEQTQTFTAKTKQGIGQITSGEFDAYKKQLIFDMNFYLTNSAIFMDKLSSFWAITQYSDISEQSFNSQEENIKSITVQSFLERSNKIEQAQYKSILESLEKEQPYVFIIINSNDFKKYKDKYIKAGFEEININNAAWYNQELFNDVKTEDPEDQKTNYTNFLIENDYYELNKNQIKQTRLRNGIPLITKYNSNTSQITMLFSIQGGYLNSADDNGFEEVMISLLINNIQKELYNYAQEGKIKGIPTISFNIDMCTSTICLECEKEDFELCCKSISNAMIYGEIIPSQADRAVANKQYSKRLENGSANYQIYCGLIKQLYPKTDLTSIFDCEKDVLQNTTYQKILESYPSLLDASRYSLIITGNFSDNLENILNRTISILSNQQKQIHYSSYETKMPSNKSINIKINHTFLTDIPKEKAGPMPAVLIPTTEFLDPVLYAFEAPDLGTRDNALFEAMLFYLEYRLNEEVRKNSRVNTTKVYVTKQKTNMNCAVITFQNVNHTKDIDSIFTSTIKEIKNELKSNKAEELLQKIKDIWITTQLAQSSTNTGTAYLIQEGFEAFPFEPKPVYYLENYNWIQTSKTDDYVDILKYFPEQPKLKVYSSEGKK